MSILFWAWLWLKNWAHIQVRIIYKQSSGYFVAYLIIHNKSLSHYHKTFLTSYDAFLLNAEITPNPESHYGLEIHDSMYDTWNNVGIVICIRQRVNIDWGVLSREGLDMAKLGDIMGNPPLSTYYEKVPWKREIAIDQERSEGRECQACNSWEHSEMNVGGLGKGNINVLGEMYCPEDEK